MNYNECAHPHCDHEIPVGHVTCAPHWRCVPAEFRKELTASAPRGGKPPSMRRIRAINRAADWLEKHWDEVST